LGIKQAHISGFLLGLGEGFIFCVYTISFWYGGKLVSENIMSFAEVIKVFMAIALTAMSIGQGAALAPDAAKAQTAANAVFSIVDHQPEIDSSSEEGEKVDTVSGSLQFIDVEFNYPTRPDVKVLNKFNLTIESGQVVALVGPSGCGKSSVISLIERFYDPASGDIKVDKFFLKDINIKCLRHQIGLVSQEPVLFSGTIAENISYGKEGATQEEIEAAARSANAHNFISEFPDGYKTQVGERGTQLSGGQKQRIAIARAIIKDPKILLLDEATSALDTESEKVVQDALDTVMKGRTTIVVAHRLSTIQHSDKICVFRDGKIHEQGTHKDLMALGGAYYELVNG